MANRGLIVEIIGDDRSFQQALSRSSAAASKFSRDINTKLGSQVSVGDRFAPLLKNTRELQGEADELGRRLETLDKGIGGVGSSADAATAGMGAMALKAGVATLAISALYQGSQTLQRSLQTTGTEAFTTSGKLKNMAAALLNTDLIGAFQALRAQPKTLEELGISAEQAGFRFEALSKVADGTAKALLEQGQGADGSKAALDRYNAIVDEAGTANQKLAKELVDQVSSLRAAQNAQEALADSTARLGTVFINTAGQAVTFKGAVDDLGGLRGPGLVDQINAALQANMGEFSQAISPGAANAAAQTIARARGDLTKLLQLQKEELARAKVALAQSRAVGAEYEKLNQAVAEATGAVISTEKAIAGNAEARRKAAEAAAKAAKAAADAAAREAKARRERLAREREALRLARLAAEQARQFRALGLTAEGEKLTPTIANLRKQLASLTRRITDTPVDTAANRGMLKRIRAVLVDPVHKATEETRKAIRDMFDVIRKEFKDPELNLRATSGLNTKKIVEGLGLSPELERIIRARLSHINTRGMALSGQTAQAIAVAGGPPVVESHITIQMDSDIVAKHVTKSQQKTRRRNPPQKRGPNSGS